MRTALPFLILLLTPLPAAAQSDLDPEDIERARVHFEAGIQHYDDENFEDAAREFEAAFQLTGHPDVLYNLAQSYDRLELYSEAIANYRRYLAEADAGAPERSRVERRVRELETLQRARQEAEDAEATEELETTEAAPMPLAPAIDEEESGPSPLPFVMIGAGVATIVAGVIFGVSASGIYSDLESRCGVDGMCVGYDPRADADKGATFATLADVLGIAGGVILGAGIVWLAVELSSGSGESEEDVASLEITSGPTLLGAGARVRF